MPIIIGTSSSRQERIRYHDRVRGQGRIFARASSKATILALLTRQTYLLRMSGGYKYPASNIEEPLQ
jgi:hypothetical protein